MGSELVMLMISSGLLTELVKWVLKRFSVSIPGNIQPAVAAVLAEAQKQLIGDGMGMLPDMTGVPDMAAMVAGAAATGGHQLLFSHRYMKKPSEPRSGQHSLLPFLLPLMIAVSGCTLFEPQTDVFRVTTDDGCRALAIMSRALADGSKDAVTHADGARSYAILQASIHTMGSECRS